MAIRSAFAFVTFAALITALPVSGIAAGTMIRGRFSFDALATCQQPAITNFPVHAEGTAQLSVDRTATLDIDSNVQGREHYSATLGGKPTEAAGGSASLRVVSKHTLKAVRDYPNNQIIVYLTVVGNSCSLKIENRLKPGKRQYTFYDNVGVAYCSKPQVTRAECTPF
jgi:hypothetical protein